MEHKTKTYVFQYRENNVGTIAVEAETLHEAFDKAQIGDGNIHIYSAEWEIGDLIGKR